MGAIPLVGNSRTIGFNEKNLKEKSEWPYDRAVEVKLFLQREFVNTL